MSQTSLWGQKIGLHPQPLRPRLNWEFRLLMRPEMYFKCRPQLLIEVNWLFWARALSARIQRTHFLMIFSIISGKTTGSCDLDTIFQARSSAIRARHERTLDVSVHTSDQKRNSCWRYKHSLLMTTTEKPWKNYYSLWCDYLPIVIINYIITAIHFA